MVRLSRRQLVPRDRIDLARLVTDPKQPWLNFYDPDRSIVFREHAPLITVQENYESLENSSNDQTTTVFKKLLSRGSRNLTQVKAKKSITYQLVNQGLCFEAICSINNTRDFLCRCLEDGDKVYMIVGFSTLVDSKFQSTSSTRSDTGVSLPVGVAMAGLTSPAVVIAGITGAVVAGASFSKDIEYSQSFEADGEYVYAVQFRKINFKRFGNRLDSGNLSSEHKWTSFLTTDARVLSIPKRDRNLIIEKLATGSAAGSTAGSPTGASLIFGALVIKLTIT
jgi:hypothetical protein